MATNDGVHTYGLFPPIETETDSHTDYCTKQVFPLVQRWIPIPILKYSKIETEICPYNGYSNDQGKSPYRDPSPSLYQWKKFCIVQCNDQGNSPYRDPSPSLLVEIVFVFDGKDQRKTQTQTLSVNKTLKLKV